jgi:hypothetical protein
MIEKLKNPNLQIWELEIIEDSKMERSFTIDAVKEDSNILFPMQQQYVIYKLLNNNLA